MTIPAGRPGLAALRARVRALEAGSAGAEGRRAVLPLGAPALDAHLPGGGLPLAGLHEIEGERAEWDDGAALGFALALLSKVLAARPGPLLWVSPRLDLYAPGLAGAGLDAGRLILARAPDEAGRLWALEEGLRAGAFAALLGEIGGLDRTAGRRLQLAAETAGLPCFVLQRQLVGLRRAAAPSAALTRWRIAPQPSAPLSFLPAVGQLASESTALALPPCGGGVGRGAAGPLAGPSAKRVSDRRTPIAPRLDPPQGGRRVFVTGMEGPATAHGSTTEAAVSMTTALAPHPAGVLRVLGPPPAAPEAPAGIPPSSGRRHDAGLARLPGRPRWRVELLRCRGAAPGDFLVEWNDASGDFGLVAPLRDGSLAGAVPPDVAAARRLAG